MSIDNVVSYEAYSQRGGTLSRQYFDDIVNAGPTMPEVKQTLAEIKENGFNVPSFDIHALWVYARLADLFPKKSAQWRFEETERILILNGYK